MTAPARVREQTRIISQWRLGFDSLQRFLRARDEYLPVPSHPSRLLNNEFPAFCRWAAHKKGILLPAEVDFEHWLSIGERRLAEVRRHELVRHLFRRPLELWMVLDYAVFLEEHGYQVRLGQFCDRSLTPQICCSMRSGFPVLHPFNTAIPEIHVGQLIKRPVIAGM